MDEKVPYVCEDESPYKGPQDPLLPSSGPRRERLTVWQKFSYGVGHFYNDMCASMWFTYLILFYHMVIHIDNTYAGLIFLIGQVADAMATPVIGFLCDKTHFRYGRRKVWHLTGTLMVTVSLFFFWHRCLLCGANPDQTKDQTKDLAKEIAYFSVFIVIFQFGWAAVQVSHLSLIPELTECESERVGLNAIRYAFTIIANMSVFGTMFILLMVVGGSKLEPQDEWVFSGTALGIIAVGLVFTAIFHIGTKEPSTPAEQRQESAQGRKLPWYKWFTNPHFYLVAVIYMCTRLIVNQTQIYVPLYLVDSLLLMKSSVAIGPMVIFTSGLIVTLVVRRFNKLIGRYMVYFCGLACVWISLMWFWLQPLPDAHTTKAEENMVYGAMIFLGAGGSILLVTSLSMVADLIGCSVGSCAFVYGLMSFTDKLSNGIAAQTIQALHPCKGHGSHVCCHACKSYYHNVLVYIPGGASLLACTALGCLVLYLYWRGQQCKESDRLSCRSEQQQRRSPIEPKDTNTTVQDYTPSEKLVVTASSNSNSDGETSPLLRKPHC